MTKSKTKTASKARKTASKARKTASKARKAVSKATMARLARARKTNAEVRAKAHYADEGTARLLAAVANAPSIPSLPNAEARRRWCVANNAPSVQRNEVARKATNYRADNAIRARLASLVRAEIIGEGYGVVWAANNAEAMLAPFSPESERVYIVREVTSK